MPHAWPLLPLLTAALPTAARLQCTFKTSVNLTFCVGGLTGHKEITSQQGCRERCCSDPACGMYEWCPNDSNGCAHWASARWCAVVP
jgi:hypothetical protein